MNAILVTGATGNVGRPLVALLTRAGLHVRAVTRDPETAHFSAGVEVVASAAEGMRGASTVFLNSRGLGTDLTAIAEAARSAGVTRLVALSAINVDDDPSRQPSRYRGDRNREVERLAVDSGLEWVSLRPTVFATNFFGMWAPQIRGGDVIAGPYAAASSAPICETDVAEVAAHAVCTDDLVGQRVPLTGPESLTNAELTEVIGGVLDRALTYTEVAAERVRERFVGLGFSPGFADAYLAMLAATLSDPAPVTDDVEKILGRPAAPFSDAVSAHRHLFADH